MGNEPADSLQPTFRVESSPFNVSPQRDHVFEQSSSSCSDRTGSEVADAPPLTRRVHPHLNGMLFTPVLSLKLTLHQENLVIRTATFYHQARRHHLVIQVWIKITGRRLKVEPSLKQQSFYTRARKCPGPVSTC